MARHVSSQARVKQAELARTQRRLSQELEEAKSSWAEIKAESEQLRGENTRLRGENEALKQTAINLAHENHILKRRLYGNKTERRTSETQLSFGDLLLDEAALDEQLAQLTADAKSASEEALAATPPPPPADEASSKPKRRGRRDLSKSQLPQTVLEIRDAQLDVQGAACIGFDETRSLMVKPASTSILVMRVAKYRVETAAGPLIESAPRPKLLFPRGILHTSVVAQLLVAKFAMGTPFYRQEQHLAARDAPIDRATMCRYAEDAGNTLGATVAHAMWKHAMTACVLSTDATGAAIQPAKPEKEKRSKDKPRENCKRGHFFTVVADCDHVLFVYAEKHDHVTVQKLFGGYRGFLQADASNVYDILDRGPPVEGDDPVLKLVGCWAHCRRYFFEAAICKYPAGVQGLMRIRAMYEMDRAFNKFPPEKRKQLRDEHLRPLIDQFFDWVEQARMHAAGRTLAAKALGYAHNQEHELRRVLDDPRLPLDNTRSERALRKVVIGRKNWLFYGSDGHAESAAALFSIIASCRLHHLDPEKYLDEVMRVLPYWPSDRYLELAPKYWPETRAKLVPAELEAPVSVITVPAR